MPKRIQRKRVRGWRMPEGAVSVGRPSRWGNPYKVGQEYDGQPLTADGAVRLFQDDALDNIMFVAKVREELAGRDLACWCREGAPCHGDVLLEIANAP